METFPDVEDVFMLHERLVNHLLPWEKKQNKKKNKAWSKTKTVCDSRGFYICNV